MPHSYRTLTAALAAVGIEEASAEASILLEHFASVSYATLMTDRDRLFSTPALEDAVARRLKREPLQYILGEWEFFGRSFTVSPHCLVPRPDTEVLVETAIPLLPEGAHIVDLCTGSGCIAIALLACRPDITADALELYSDTLALAVENAKRNKVGLRFAPICADLLGEGAQVLAPRSPYDAILSNPPYIPTADIEGLSPEVRQEPLAALDGGEDGLLFYRAILRDYACLVRPGGHILLEMGYDQGEALRSLALEYLPAASVEIISDLGGNDRVTKITLPDL